MVDKVKTQIHRIRNKLRYAQYTTLAAGSLAKTLYLMNKQPENGVMRAPFISGLNLLECAKYARLSAEFLSGAKYAPAPAWDLGDRNQVVKEINGNLEDFVPELIQGKTIVLFYNPYSRFNQKGRIGTHATVYLGKKKDLMFAEQYFFAQRAVSYTKLQKRGLIARQILTPAD